MADSKTTLNRTLGLWDLIFYGIILIQPTAPMPLFGVLTQQAQGHAATAILIAMAAMLLTGISYGRMASVYPSAGSAFTYVGRELHPTAGFLTGWAMSLDYLLNPVICTIWCSKAAINIFPQVPYATWAVFFAVLFTSLNLRGIRATARTNEVLVVAMGIVVVSFFVTAVRYLSGVPADLTQPFYDPATFNWENITTGTSLAVLTYIGFDGISTLSEEVRNPRRNIMLATVLTCLIIGALSLAQVYLGQLIWPDFKTYPDADTAFVHVAGRAGGEWLFHAVNLTLLVATIGSGTGAQLAGARLLYGMGRDGVLPRSFFAYIEPKRRVPRNNVLFAGAVALVGAFSMSYQLGAELLNFGAILGFLGVNLSAFVHFFVRGKRTFWNFALPLGGFAICFVLWIRLRWPALVAGFIWLAVGLIYTAFRTNGFRKPLTLSEIPEETNG